MPLLLNFGAYKKYVFLIYFIIDKRNALCYVVNMYDRRIYVLKASRRRRSYLYIKRYLAGDTSVRCLNRILEIYAEYRTTTSRANEARLVNKRRIIRYRYANTHYVYWHELFKFAKDYKKGYKIMAKHSVKKAAIKADNTKSQCVKTLADAPAVKLDSAEETVFKAVVSRLENGDAVDGFAILPNELKARNNPAVEAQVVIFEDKRVLCLLK